jgi:DNA-binding transcriptional LysR family regulator
MTITLNQYRYFSALAEVGHFGRAAERLHISQPPLSRQIAALEAELGAILLERTSKGVVLTAAGRQFHKDAQDVLRAAAIARRNVAAASHGEVGELTLGFTMCAAYNIVPILMRQYRSAFPQVTFRVRELMPLALERELGEGKLDAGISFPGLTHPEVTSEPLFREPLELILPRGHRIATRRYPRVRDLAEETFLIVPREQAPTLYDSVVQCCRNAGFTPRIGLEVYLQQTIVNFVAEGMGIALVPASMQRANHRGAVFRPIASPPSIDLVLAWHTANTNPCLTHFRAIGARLTHQAFTRTSNRGSSGSVAASDTTTQ